MMGKSYASPIYKSRLQEVRSNQPVLKEKLRSARGFFEPRQEYLRNKHRAPLKQRAREVLGEEDAVTLLNELRAASLYEDEFDAWARNILRKCARIETRARRHAYIRACIAAQEMEQRRAELELWFEERDEAFAMMTDEELRRPDPEYDRRKREVEQELAAMNASGLRVLATRIGMLKAWGLAQRVIRVIGANSDARLNSILRNAAQARLPDRYIAAVIVNQRQ